MTKPEIEMPRVFASTTRLLVTTPERREYSYASWGVPDLKMAQFGKRVRQDSPIEGYRLTYARFCPYPFTRSEYLDVCAQLLKSGLAYRQGRGVYLNKRGVVVLLRYSTLPDVPTPFADVQGELAEFTH